MTESITTKEPVRQRACFVLVASWLCLGPKHHVKAEPCSVCADGQKITKPDYAFDTDAVPLPDCASLEYSAGFLDSEESYCKSIQKVGTLCGCDYDETKACTLCHDGAPASRPDKILEGMMALDMVMGAPSGTPLTCELLEAVLHQESNTDEKCLAYQGLYWEDCGCAAPPQSTALAPSQNQTEGSLPPFVAEESQQVLQPCAVCVDEEPISWPDKEIHFAGLPINNCGDLANYAGLLRNDSRYCFDLQTIGTYCGCTYTRNDCRLCPNGEEVPRPNTKITWMSGYLRDVPDSLVPFAESMTCAMLDASLQNLGDVLDSESSASCYGSQLKSSICGCSPDSAMLWVVHGQRVSGITSLFCSTLIIADIFWNRNHRKTYHQILLGISSYDVMSSILYAVGTVMAPVSSGLYNAKGNNLTCKIQGFGLQWALASFFYNAILSVYFLLAINHGWTESKFRRFRRRVHVFVNVVGLALAFGALPYYDAGIGFCTIMRPPVITSYLPPVMFHTVPLGVAVVLLVVPTVLLCRKVYSKESRSDQYNSRNIASDSSSRRKQKSRISRRVFWHSLLYVTSAVVMVPFLVVYTFIRHSKESIQYYIIVAIVVPFQGVLNALVYFHRKGTIGKWCRRVKKSQPHHFSSTSFRFTVQHSREGYAALPEFLDSSEGRTTQDTRSAPDLATSSISLHSPTLAYMPDPHQASMKGNDLEQPSR